MNRAIEIIFILSLLTIVGVYKNNAGCLVTAPLTSKIFCHPFVDPVEVEWMTNVKDILYCFLKVGISRRFGCALTSDGLNSEKTQLSLDKV